MATHFVKPLYESILHISEVQDCAKRCQNLFLTSPLAIEPYVIAQSNGIDSANDDIIGARQYEQKNSHTVTSADADTYRDRRYSIFFTQVDSKTDLIDDEPEMAEAAIKIKAIALKHCKGLSKMNRVTESTALTNLFAELTLPENNDLVDNADVARYLSKLQEAQISYETADAQKVNEAVSKGIYIKPTKSADKIVYRLEALFTYLDSLTMDAHETHKELVNSINEIIDSVTIPARARETRKHSA